MRGPREGGPDPKVLAEAIRRVVAVAHPERIILFGSAARGGMGADSDLDLLVVVRGPVYGGRLLERIYVALVGVGSPVDVIAVTPEDLKAHRDKPGTFLGTALEEGEVVYGE